MRSHCEVMNRSMNPSPLKEICSSKKVRPKQAVVPVIFCVCFLIKFFMVSASKWLFGNYHFCDWTQDFSKLIGCGHQAALRIMG